MAMAEPIIYLRDPPRDHVVRQLLPDYPHADLATVECYLLLLRLVHEMVGRVESLLGRYNLSRGRLAVLMVLRRHAPKGLNAAALAYQCGVTRATMTGLLGRLERAGLIRRQAHDFDGRMSHIYLSPGGRQIMRKVLPGYYELIQSLATPLNVRHMGSFKSTLNLLLCHLTPEVRDCNNCGQAARPTGRGRRSGRQGRQPGPSVNRIKGGKP